MKTLADLKRDLSKGTVLTLTGGAYATDRINPILNVPRYVVKTQGNAVVLNMDANATNGSWLEFPPARLLTYDGDTFTVHMPGTRPLTADEQRVMDTMPSKRPENRERVANDLMTDGSQMYHADRAHTRAHNMTHLDGFETVRGLRYDWNSNLITDETIKGPVTLAYHIIK